MSIKIYDKSGSTPQEKLLAGVSPVDAILNNSSTNAIQNKAVYNALKEKVEKTVTDLVNYYDKSQVYNKTETRAMVDAISTMTIEVVTALPTTDISTTTIYFLRQGSTNVYDQYVYVNGAWVKIGDTTVDLSQYLTIANFNIAIADYYTKSEIDTLLANVDIDVDSALDSVSENPVQNKVLKTEFDKKADKVTSATNGNVATLDANGNLLDGGKALSALPTTFVGTTAEWETLSATEKNKYTLVNLTDDDETGGENKWKKWGNNVVGKTLVTLPEKYDELYVHIEAGSTYEFNQYFIKDVLKDEAVSDLSMGYYYSTSNYGMVNLRISKTTAQLITVRCVDADYDNTAVMQIYYR